MTANATVTSICNRALGAIGTRTTIQSITDGSNEANQCALYYDPTRQELLRSAYWNCARKQANLTVVKAAPGTPENTAAGTTTWDPSTQPPPPWLYEYAVPSDGLRMRYIVPQINTYFSGTPNLFSTPLGVPSVTPYTTIGAVPFRMAYDNVGIGQQEVILTNQMQAMGVYTVDLQSPVIFDSQFEAALVSALAAYLAIPLTGSLQIRGQQAADATNRVINARVSDGNEGGETQNREASWMLARGLYANMWDVTTMLGFIDPGFFAWA